MTFQRPDREIDVEKQAAAEEFEKKLRLGFSEEELQSKPYYELLVIEDRLLLQREITPTETKYGDYNYDRGPGAGVVMLLVIAIWFGCFLPLVAYFNSLDLPDSSTIIITPILLLIPTIISFFLAHKIWKANGLVMRTAIRRAIYYWPVTLFILSFIGLSANGL